MDVKRGDIYLVNLNPVKGNEQKGIRPCLVVQNDVSNQYSPLTIVAAITSTIKSKKFITNVMISRNQTGLDKESIVLLNQIKTVDKSRIIKKIGSASKDLMSEVDKALKISLDLD